MPRLQNIGTKERRKLNSQFPGWWQYQNAHPGELRIDLKYNIVSPYRSRIVQGASREILDGSFRSARQSGDEVFNRLGSLERENESLRLKLNEYQFAFQERVNNAVTRKLIAENAHREESAIASPAAWKILALVSQTPNCSLVDVVETVRSEEDSILALGPLVHEGYLILSDGICSLSYKAECFLKEIGILTLAKIPAFSIDGCPET